MTSPISCTLSARGTATSTTSAPVSIRRIPDCACGASRSRSGRVRSLSASEIVEAARARLADDAPLSQSDASALLSDAIKLYVSASADPYGDEALAGLTV